MRVIVIHSSGFVTSYFGPFNSKKEASEWAKEADLTNFSLVVLMNPYVMEESPRERG